MVKPVAWMYDNGSWEADTNDEKVWIESDDFTHDAILYVYGDFADIPQQLSYAKEIAKRLNTAPRELSDEEIYEVWSTLPYDDQCPFDGRATYRFARAILKKASEK